MQPPDPAGGPSSVASSSSSLHLSSPSDVVRLADHIRRYLLACSADGLARQIFLSHTGADKDALDFTTCILQPALQHAGLKVVIDYKALNPGCEWANKLVDFAANSQVVVVVLSRSFSKRFWCMVELDLALHGRKQLGGAAAQTQPYVIPVFYDPHEEVVLPEKVVQFWRQPQRWDKHAGKYGPALSLEDYLAQEEDLSGYSSDDWKQCVEPERWARNMQRMRELQHERVGNYPAKDGKLQAVVRVRGECVRQMPVLAAVGPVFGFKEQLESLAERLDAGKLGVFLYGHGGKGKTTLGTELCNLMATIGSFPDKPVMVMLEFHDSGFPARVNYSALAGHLKDAVLVLGVEEKDIAGYTYQQLATVLQNCVASRKVLYFLDNVQDNAQLRYLLPSQWGAGSVVIVTGRSDALRVPEELHRHEVLELAKAASQQLFHQWLEFVPDPPLHDLENKLLGLCNGLPLALELVGGILARNHDPSVWQAELRLLEQGSLSDDLYARLQGLVTHSLKGLCPAAVAMFLDVATVLASKPGWLVQEVWDAWHTGAAAHLRRLQERGLVKVGSGGLLAMHDVLMAVGRGMVLDPTSAHHGTRLWVQGGVVLGIPEDALQRQQVCVLVAQLDAALGEVYGTGRLKTPLLPQMAYPVASLNWTATRILLAGRVQVPLGAKLLWVELHRLAGSEPVTGSSAASLLPVFTTSSLHMPGSRVVFLGNCSRLAALPAFIPSAAHLRQLILWNCTKMAGPLAGLQRLTELRQLELTDVATHIPLDCLQHLVRLERLVLYGHAQLESADWLSPLSKLSWLNLAQCPRLTFMPALTHMTGLRGLILSGCENLATVGLGEQHAGMEVLDVQECRALTTLHLQHLTALKNLNLQDCIQLSRQQACHSFQHLQKLESLDLAGFVEHGDHVNVRNLGKLTRLNLMRCRFSLLPQLEGLTSLRFFQVSGCTNLEGFPSSISQLTSLTALVAVDTGKLRNLPHAFAELRALARLTLTHCKGVSDLAVLGQLSSLARVRISGLKGLVTLPASFSALTSLQSLAMSALPDLVTLPADFGHLVALTHLDLGECPNLQELPSELSQLTTLKELWIVGCTRLHVPTVLGQLSWLKALEISQPAGLETLPASFLALTRLQRLRMTGSPNLVTLPADIGHFVALTHLNLSECPNLQELPSELSQLTTLKELFINGCTRPHVPEALRNMAHLKIWM